MVPRSLPITQKFSIIAKILSKAPKLINQLPLFFKSRQIIYIREREMLLLCRGSNRSTVLGVQMAKPHLYWFIINYFWGLKWLSIHSLCKIRIYNDLPHRNRAVSLLSWNIGAKPQTPLYMYPWYDTPTERPHRLIIYVISKLTTDVFNIDFKCEKEKLCRRKIDRLSKKSQVLSF